MMADTSLYKKLYQILTWSSVAGLAITLLLVLKKSPPPNVPYDPTASARVEQKFAAADQAKAAGQPAAVQMDPTELNSYLKDNLETEGSAAAAAAAANNATNQSGSSAPNSAPDSGNANGAAALDALTQATGADPQTIEEAQSAVKDVKVDMVGDLVKAYVIYDLHGKDVSLELDGHLSSENGYLKFDPVAGKLGSLPLPQAALQAAVDKMMNSPENREKLKLPGDVSDIQIQDGQAKVTYKP
jgi:hypothetical protein